MTKVLIATFSQTGSTRKIADQIANGLKTANLDVAHLNITRDAIHSALDWIIFSPFMYYNLARSKDKKVPFANVKHKNGKTIVI